MTPIFRETKQRNAIKHAIEKHPTRALSPKEILELACAEVPDLGIATVYRNIKTMVDKGELESVLLPGRADRYQDPQFLQRHILIDDKNDQVFTMPLRAIPDDLLPEIDGYKVYSHQIIVWAVANES